MRHLSLLFGAALAVACASNPPPEPAPPAPAEPAPPAPPPPAEPAPPPPPAPAAGAQQVVGPPEVAWKDMTKEQKGRFMKAVVVPKMKPLFNSFDPEMFQKVDCATCHGTDAKSKGFKMPNPELFVLPGTPAEFAELAQKKPKWIKFMGEQVKPQMAALLGLKNFDPRAPDPAAFGCHNCHTTKGK
jgi:hypothetical protein